ncbi:FAD-dependent oxidoreductase [Thalassobaculum sp.]|uniref:FAD-dependent oxidoreductase n=1 Tax=Thalassobaculum sp. TaxID=2022740 RepID=UPI003B59A57A
MGIVRRETGPEAHVPVLVIGAGACGLIAALAAHDAGAEVMVLERDPVPAGSTSLSAGYIPACNTRWQKEAGAEDGVDRMLGDIQKKNHGEGDPVLGRAVCEASGPALEWLADTHGQSFILETAFRYPGHTAYRMHSHPQKTGVALVGSLAAAAERAGIDIVCEAPVRDLIADEAGRVLGVVIERPDGSTDEIGCDALVLACNGYGGNQEMLRTYIPEMADALYFGHTGNQGDAVRWGTELGAAVAQMGSYQGHGSVAHPHGALISWALMMEGGVQVNTEGQRFSNEHAGYSEQALKVLAQPGGIAWNVYDQRLHELGMRHEDYRGANEMGAIRELSDLAALADLIGCPLDRLAATLAHAAEAAAGRDEDPFGRDFTTAPTLDAPPYYAVRVTGALFHTQGGLSIDTDARVLTAAGEVLPNLFAGGGAAVGLSGSGVEGYLSGNGLLTAVTLGRIAGTGAARLAQETAA